VLTNLRVMFIGLFRWSLSVFSKIGLLSVESQHTPGLARFVNNGLRWSALVISYLVGHRSKNSSVMLWV